MQTKTVSIIAFYDAQKRILMQCRIGRGNLDVEWGFFGGSIEQGETPKQALIREIKEELNYELKENEFEFLGEFKTNRKDKIIHAFVFFSSLDNKLSKFTQLEGDKMQLFSFKEAEKLKIINSDLEAIKKLKETL